MTMMFSSRVLLASAVTLLVVGFERLLNAYFLQGSPAAPGRVLFGLGFTAGGLALIGVLAIHGRGRSSRRQRRSRDV